MSTHVKNLSPLRELRFIYLGCVRFHMGCWVKYSTGLQLLSLNDWVIALPWDHVSLRWAEREGEQRARSTERMMEAYRVFYLPARVDTSSHFWAGPVWNLTPPHLWKLQEVPLDSVQFLVSQPISPSSHSALTYFTWLQCLIALETESDIISALKKRTRTGQALELLASRWCFDSLLTSVYFSTAKALLPPSSPVLIGTVWYGSYQ